MKRRYWVLLGVIVLMAVINVVAWKSAAFCDFYVCNIYPLWVSTYGRLTGLFPFSVGEIMLVAGVMLTIIAALLGIVAVVLLIYKGFRFMMHKTPDSSGLYSRVIRVCGKYWEVYTWVLAGVFVIMTLNCFISFHCSTLEEKYGLFDKVTVDDPMLQELTDK